jgi:hypothetical protein
MTTRDAGFMMKNVRVASVAMRVVCGAVFSFSRTLFT